MLQTTSIAELFKAMGYDWKKLQVNEAITVSELGFKIRSFNVTDKKDEFKLITKIIRKSDALEYKVIVNSDEFSCSADHKLFVTMDDVKNLHAVEVGELLKLSDKFCLWDGEQLQKFRIEKTNNKIFILDIEVKDNHNYYSNNVLSHNTLFGSPESIGVGNALKFFASMRVDLRRKEQHKVGDVITGNHINAKIIKNKLAPPFRQAEYDFYFDTGFDFESSLLRPALECGVIERVGTWFLFEGERIVNGSKNFGSVMREKPDLYNKILEKTKKAELKEVSKMDEETGEVE